MGRLKIKDEEKKVPIIITTKRSNVKIVGRSLNYEKAMKNVKQRMQTHFEKLLSEASCIVEGVTP
jgi:rRNA processing protein Krr1/Pno1